MMDYETITTAIGTLGFPIFAFILIYVDLRKLIKENSRIINKLIMTLEISNCN